MCASRLPQATAVNTPAMTAKAQPLVITIQPAPSALVRLRSTLATTPFPNRIRTMVPMNSPSNGEAMLIPPHSPDVNSRPEPRNAAATVVAYNPQITQKMLGLYSARQQLGGRR